MERSKCGLVVGGDKRKMLVNHDDDYYTLMSKCRKVLGLTEPNSLLIAGGAISGNDSFHNVHGSLHDGDAPKTRQGAIWL